MTMLHIELPEELRAKLAEQAEADGFQSVENYARAILEASAIQEVDTETERVLLERLKDTRPGVPLDEFRRQFPDSETI